MRAYIKCRTYEQLLRAMRTFQSDNDWKPAERYRSLAPYVVRVAGEDSGFVPTDTHDPMDFYLNHFGPAPRFTYEEVFNRD